MVVSAWLVMVVEEELVGGEPVGSSRKTLTYCIWQNVRGGNFRSFSLNRKCFPMNYGLVNWQCKSTCMLHVPQKFLREWQFCTLTTKVFPLESFAIYSTSS